MHLSTVMKLHALMQMKGPHQSIARSLPRLGNTGNHVEIGIELHEPIKHLLRYRNSIHVREESRVEGEWFLPKSFMIGSTISWNRHGTLALLFIWMIRILTAHSKGNAPTTEIDKHYPPLLSHNHCGLTRTVCFTISSCIRSIHRVSGRHMAKQKSINSG